MSETWFTSDTHFSHQNLMQHYKHRLDCGSVENMIEVMIAKWNDRVRPGDTVYHTGDFGGKDSLLDAKIAWRLNGKLHFLPGNHDRKILKQPKFVNRCSVIYPYSYAEISIDKQKIVLCHYPIWEWNQLHRGWWHLHGHLHAKPHGIPGKIMDIGSDGNDLAPYHLDEVRKFMDARPIRYHHANEDE